MLRRVRVPTRRFAGYEKLVEPSLYREVELRAKALEGRRVLQINSTSQGGGVAEILRSETGLLNDLGIQASWQVLTATDPFFEVTKKIHNGLQGGPVTLSEKELAVYEAVNQRLAAEVDPSQWDLIIVHDPQPCAMRGFIATGGPPWVWRCHIDLSRSDPALAERFFRYVQPYDADVYSASAYVRPKARRPAVIAPAIDPLSAKNRDMGVEEAKSRVAKFGIDPQRPLVTQVSRFDAWKDPLGVIEAWKAARKRVPGLQLALVGEYARDDPEGETVLTQVRAAANGLPGIFIIPNRADDRAVHAFYAASDVVVQKSLREGFGLTVSEAMWAGTPVVGGAVGGIPLQIQPGENGFLVKGAQEAAEAIVRLCGGARLRARMADAGRARVRRDFLLPRLVRDNLHLWQSLVERAAGRNGAARSRVRRSRVRPRVALARRRSV